MFSKNELSEENSSLRPKRRWSILHRLTTLYFAASFLMLLAATAYLYWSLIGNLAREDNAFIGDKIRELRSQIRDDPDGLQKARSFREKTASAEPAQPSLEYYVRVLKANGETVAEARGMSDLAPVAMFPPPVGTDAVPQKGVELTLRNRGSFRLTSALADAGTASDQKYLVQVAFDVTRDAALVASFRRNVFVLMAVGLVAACIAGVLIAKKGLQPLENLTRATERINMNQLHGRIARDGWPTELASLASGFNRMLGRLEDSFSRLSQFSGDLAHELRTPINNLRGEADVALLQTRTPEQYQRVLESSLEEYERLTRLIESLLFLARADAPQACIQRSRFDARRAVDDVREYYEALAEERGVTVVCEGHATVEADPTLFRQAASNLLSNALNFTPPGGKVLVGVHQNNDVLELIVRDNGCGIAVEQLPKIFDRLYREDKARSQVPGGSGLGLPIVKSIVGMHGGTVGVRSDIGKGSCFTLTFPPTPVRAPGLT